MTPIEQLLLKSREKREALRFDIINYPGFNKDFELAVFARTTGEAKDKIIKVLMGFTQEICEARDCRNSCNCFCCETLAQANKIAAEALDGQPKL